MLNCLMASLADVIPLDFEKKDDDETKSDNEEMKKDTIEEDEESNEMCEKCKEQFKSVVLCESCQEKWIEEFDKIAKYKTFYLSFNVFYLFRRYIISCNGSKKKCCGMKMFQSGDNRTLPKEL